MSTQIAHAEPDWRVCMFDAHIIRNQSRIIAEIQRGGRYTAAVEMIGLNSMGFPREECSEAIGGCVC